MREFLLVAIPILGALAAAAWPRERSRPLLLPTVGALHLALVTWLFFAPPVVPPHAWFGFDPLARAVLPVVSLLFLTCAAYGVTYLRLRGERPNRVFVVALLLLLALMSAAHQALHLGMAWIFTEAVTLVAVPLLHFNNSPRAFEATWKYLLVGGTGIAFSLLGSFCIGYASILGRGNGDLTFVALIAQGPALERAWVLIGWVLLLVGYGTKMGLAPMHTWKPDAYGEAPGVVGALLAGGVTTVAFTALMRAFGAVVASGADAQAVRSVAVIGVFSILVAALFLLGTRDFKRMLAYSSVEHMGILMVGAALGPPGLFASLFHVWSNTLAKGSLFMSAGNLRRAGGSRTNEEISGLAAVCPRSASLFVAGMFAVTACPPFAPFFSELLILRTAFSQGHYLVAGLFLIGLLLAFFGLTRLVFSVVDGPLRTAVPQGTKLVLETFGVLWTPIVLLGLSIWLGLATPAVLREAWTLAVRVVYPAS